ncbi:MAG: nitroreductase family protein [Arachnia sp.]
MTTTTASTRTAATDAPILDVLAQRWSTRVFDTSAAIDEAALASALEAARWAPTANNLQPWRAILARRGTAEHATLVASLSGFNAAWAPSAGALVAFVAETERDGQPLRFAEYDAGQAAAHFTIQAHASGLVTHQMGGFDRAAIAEAFGLDTTLLPITVIAVGALGDVRSASEELQSRESAPRTRRPVAESVLVDA